MATISITIPDAHLQRAIDALCNAGGWTPQSPLSRPAFAQRYIARFVRNTIRQVEEAAAEAVALQQARVSITDVDVT